MLELAIEQRNRFHSVQVESQAKPDGIELSEKGNL